MAPMLTLLMSLFSCIGVLACLPFASATSTVEHSRSTGINFGNGDFHYPQEEQAEHATAVKDLPRVISWSSSFMFVGLQCPASGEVQNVNVDDSIICGVCTWYVRAMWSNATTTLSVVLEQKFDRWGLLAFVDSAEQGKGISQTLLRMPVGQLASIRQPRFNLSDAYLTQVANAVVDLPTQLAMNATADGEPDYPTIAATLTPQRDTMAISHAADVVKFAVAYSGRVKCASTGVLIEDSTTGGIAEFQDLHSAPPDSQKVIFDPATYVSYWPRSFQHMKSGLVGGRNGIANVGAFTPSVSVGAGGGQGFELISFGPVPPQEAGGVPPPFPYTPGPTPPTPKWECFHYTTSTEAWIEECLKKGGSDSVCQREACSSTNASYVYTGGNNTDYQGCGTCYCCMPYVDPGPLPRLSNINYNPGVFVMLRETVVSHTNTTATSSANESSRYFYATNHSTNPLPLNTGGASFYKALLAVHVKNTAILAPAMQLQLPASDTRQHDMVLASMLATSNNFVGLQPNYGFGATYWSYGREDNGSLPLDMLSVDDALLTWGVCDVALAHIGFYMDNYISDEGTVLYFIPPWTTQGDSIADYGRLIDIFLRATKLCKAPVVWQEKYSPIVSRIGALLLRLRSEAPPSVKPGTTPTSCVYGLEVNNTFLAGNSLGGNARTLEMAMKHCDLAVDCGGITQQYGEYQCRQGRVPVPGDPPKPMANSWPITNNCHVAPGTGGLIIGAPEHDFSNDKTHYYYNNNVWSLYGMETLGAYLTATGAGLPSGRNATLGEELVADAAKYRVDLANSIKTCTTNFTNGGKTFQYLPVYAEINASIPVNMHVDAKSSYANFRFFSEPMLTGTSIVPAEVEQGWLHLHNQLGGRLGGASRFEDHLDDMPTAGWGYGALVANQTEDFLALLYGHMATYQSSGSFHSTEQLSFYGSDRYRDFLNIPDPAPPSPNTTTLATSNTSNTTTNTAKVMKRRSERGGNLGYNGKEVGESFCIVSNILMARMTRWQLIMEDAGSVWIGRGAPQRWFRSLGGFNVTNAPTLSVGAVSYNLTVGVDESEEGESTKYNAKYSVISEKSGEEAGVRWSLRWPGVVDPTHVQCTGCTIDIIDSSRGIVTVRASVTTFTVSTSWCSNGRGPAACTSV